VTATTFPAGSPVVEVRALRRTFGTNEALAGVDLSFPPGAVGLLGPNGAGKSTLLKILLGLLPPSSGEVRVLGIDPTRDPVEVRRRVGYMPEVDAFCTGLSAVESVRLAGILSGMPAAAATQRAHGVLGYVGLDEARYRRVEEYSTGMRQRVRLAQALVHDPALLFLDEPTNGLDPAGREEILEVIRDLAVRHGKHVVLCSHLLRDVEATCTSMVFLSRGRAVRSGTLAELVQGRKDVYVVRVRGEPEAFLAALRARDAAPERVEGALRVVVPAGAGTAPILEAAAESGIDLRGVVPDVLTLEDAFVAAVDAGAGAR
jgi:ABC-2 type transport system ATP-binding protein